MTLDEIKALENELHNIRSSSSASMITTELLAFIAKRLIGIEAGILALNAALTEQKVEA